MEQSKSLFDRFGRKHDYLRLSLTNVCNLNCIYCNPLSDGGSQVTYNANLLSLEKIERIMKLFAVELGFKKLRFTGGEPLARKEFSEILKSAAILKKEYGFELGITTNATLLNRYIELMKSSNVNKINISLDSVNTASFLSMTGHNKAHEVLSAINETINTGFDEIKINCVVMRGFNDNEILDFIEYFKKQDLTVRFIEYMPFTENGWNNSLFVSVQEIKSIILSKYELFQTEQGPNSVSKDFRAAGINCRIGFISSISDHFCGGCNRLRITSDGRMRLCLFGDKSSELDLNEFMEAGLSDSQIADAIRVHLLEKKFEHPSPEELVKLDTNYMLRNGG